MAYFLSQARANAAVEHEVRGHFGGRGARYEDTQEQTKSELPSLKIMQGETQYSKAGELHL